MRYAFFLILLVAINCEAQDKSKSTPPKVTVIREAHVNIPVFTDACSYKGNRYSHVMTLISSQNPKEPLLIIENENRERIAYLSYDSTLVIIDTLATINQLIKHIYAQEHTINTTVKELDAAYSRNRAMVKTYNGLIDTQKKVWKELVDKLTVKK